MTGFFENNTSANSTPTTDATVTTEASFYGLYPNGDPMTIAQPFEGVLQPGTAHIGSVNVDNFPSSFAITNFPGTQAVTVGNFPAVQRVSLDFPAQQAVNVLNLPADQQVHGAVSITNFPANQNVTLTGDSTVKALLLSGTSHIGSVNLDAPITGTVMVSNFPANQPVTVGNFPQTQAVTGTVSVGNFPSQTKIDTSTPLDVWIRGSDVSLGDGSSTGGGSLNGNVTIINTGAKPVPVSIVGGQSTFSGSLSAGTAHIGQVSIDQPVTISGTVPVSLVSVPTHGVTIQGTPSVAIANPITHLSIDNLPAVQAVSGSVSISNLPPTQVVSGTVNIGNLPATQVVSGIVSLAANSAVQVSGKVQVDTSTPLQVAVPASISVKNDGSNLLATTLTTGDGTVGSDNPLPVQFLSAIQVDTTVPLRVEVTNPSTGGGSGPSTLDGNVTVSGGTLSGITNVVQ
uniref:hypothetical protein n=1 Tax=Methylobacterium sp. B34 TaxID=95563 RepID=UPI0005B2DCA0